MKVSKSRLWSHGGRQYIVLGVRAVFSFFVPRRDIYRARPSLYMIHYQKFNLGFLSLAPQSGVPATVRFLRGGVFYEVGVLRRLQASIQFV